ncbi:MAG: HAMP domain-containing sensor histidine kinase [Paracoccaceae bacterium]
MKCDQTITSWKRYIGRLSPSIIFAIASVSQVLAGTDDDDYDALPGRSEEQISALIFNFDEVVETIVLYAAFFSILLILLVISLSLRLKLWAAYVGLTILSFIWFAFFEQDATGLFWIGLQIDSVTLIYSGFALASLHLILSGLSISKGNRLEKIRVLHFIAAGLILLLPFAQTQVAIQNVPFEFYAVAAFACLSHGVPILSFRAMHGPTVRVARNGLAFVLVMALAGVVILVFGELDEGLDTIFIVRIAMIGVIGFFILFFTRYILSILSERDRILRNSLSSAKSEAKMNLALLESEKKYARAREAARIQNMRLATASHDIRQPITSLRATMAVVTKDQPRDVQEQLNSAFEYLDQLAASYTGEQDAQTGETPTQSDQFGDREMVSSGVISSTLERMFRMEAENKGLGFEVAIQEAQLCVQPLVVTRILSNLLSNAIKHTANGKISFHAENQAQGFQFSVSNSESLPETGDSPAMFEAYVKGEASSGSGLGLAIVKELAKNVGLNLSWTSTPNLGTTFNLFVPS